MDATKYIFLDTNNWIYLSNGYDILNQKHDELHFKLFDVLKRGERTKILQILTNDIIIEEWRRNKKETEKQIERLTNQHKEKTRILNCIKESIPEEGKNIDHILLKLEEAFIEKKSQHFKHISDVEKFLEEQTIKVPITDKTKNKAIEIALAKKAPFCGDKSNSMADALIFLSALEFIEEQKDIIPDIFNTNNGQDEIIFPASYFASSNKGDFSDPKNSTIIHPHLKPYLDKTETQFKYSLKELILSLEKDVLTIEEILYLEDFERDAPCEYCYTDYLPSVQFTRTIKVKDESNDTSLVGQFIIPFDGGKPRHYTKDDFKTELRVATCYHCGADYLECPCGTLNYFEHTDEIYSCQGNCGRAYLMYFDKDGSYDITMLRDNKCLGCGDRYEKLNEHSLCEHCADFY